MSRSALTLAPLAAVALALAALSPRPLAAQVTGTIEYTLSDTSSYFDDCDPGTLCLVVFCGVFDGGTMTFTYTGFDGTFDNYDVTAVDWPVHISFCPADSTAPITTFSGSGTFQIDRELVPSQRLLLELDRSSGPPSPITADSGFVQGMAPFPEFLDFDVVSFDTAETFTITATPTLSGSPPFRRGDANADGLFDIADPLFTLNGLAVPGSPPPPCWSAADGNDDGQVNIADAVYELSALFVAGSPPPPSPHDACDLDPTDDGLTCDAYDACD